MYEHIKKAAALQYEMGKDTAPKVIAKGKGEIAWQIIARAREYEIPIFQNEALANSLINIELDESIPSDLYEAVVELFIWLYKSEQKAQISN